eukprot:TRINITY_DN314_c0_g1_i1.p1 TRINITY_DN314_c0_g1~~TRINITY_DN314_c0_g1_i1.p1  ORF type:complete len:567 (+),score=187.23 TRINITY_DN314_c0_g1_i1:253-1701(+)
MTDIAMLAVEKYNRFRNSALLDLSGFSEVEEMKKHNPNFNNGLWCAVLASIVKRCKTVTAISLDHNKIRSLEEMSRRLSELASSLPNFCLESISLCNNIIESITEIKHLSKFGLKHLLLEGNTIYKCNKELLLKALKVGLPTLCRIDSQPLDRRLAIDSSVTCRTLGDDGVEGTVQNFMGAYFSLANTKGKVNELLDSYDAKATFTLTLGDRFGLGSVGGQFVKSLWKLNHDVLRTTNVKQCRGKLEVGKALEVLHSEVVEVTQTVREMTEVTTLVPQLLQDTRIPMNLVTVTMHGSVVFKIKSGSGNDAKVVPLERYFDRTWVLAPAGGNGAPVIINDMLHLRNPKGAESPVFHGESLSGFIYTPHMNDQDEKIIRLSAETKLLPQLSSQLLAGEEISWNLEKAMAEVQRCQSTGQLNASHFNQAATRESLTLEVFCRLTNLVDEMARMCIGHDQVQFNLLLGWRLFIEKRPSLQPSHFRS